MQRFFMALFVAALVVGAFGAAQAVIIVPGPFPAAPFGGTVIDFEGLGEGTLIGNYYSGLGVQFSQPDGGRPMIDNKDFLYAYESGSGAGVLTGSEEGGAPYPTIAGIVATFFDEPVSRVGAFFSDTVPLGDYTFQIFAPGGALLESYLLPYGDPALPTLANGGATDMDTPWNGTGGGLFVGFDMGSNVIGSIQFGPGNVDGDAFSIDDFRFGRATTPVPEPSTILLVGLGLVGVAVARRKAAR